jgi:DNA-binding transcriptional ArsR family regulator
VLLFTCHPFTRDVFLDIADAVPVIELPLQEVPECVAAGQRTAAEGQVSEPAAYDDEPDELLRPRVLAALAETELGMTDLCTRLGCSADRLRPILMALRESGLVEMSGQRRGARYRLASDADASA